MTTAKKGKRKKPKSPEEIPDPEVSIAIERPPAKPRIIDRLAAKTGTRFYRLIETISFIYAIINLGALMTVEVLHRAGFRFGNAEPDHGFPYGVLIGSVILIAPKLIGRAFAGRALVAIAGGQSTGTTAERETTGAD